MSALKRVWKLVEKKKDKRGEFCYVFTRGRERMVVRTTQCFDDRDTHFRFLKPFVLRGREVKHPELCWQREGLSKGPLPVVVLRSTSGEAR